MTEIQRPHFQSWSLSWVLTFHVIPSLGASQQRGWICWSPWFSPAQHFCNSRGLPAAFWESKPSYRKRICLCVKNGQDCLCALHIVGAHKDGWNWCVEGIKWQTSNRSAEIHVHVLSSVLPSLTHSRQLLTVAPGTMPGCHFSNL